MAKLWTRTSDMAVAPSVAGGVAFHLRSRSRSVVVAAGAGADAGHVGAVDVDRDRGLAGGVVHAVDVAGRREAADVADVVDPAADQIQVGVEELLLLGALNDGERAPDRKSVV